MKDITQLIMDAEGLIYSIINKYKNYFELDDLYQVAVLGLIKAYKNYNDKYNVKFTSYAYPYILGEVIKYVNEFRNIKVNKSTKMLYTRILHAKEILTQKLMKEPTTYDLSLFLEIDERIINEVITANQIVDSLDKIIDLDNVNFSMYNKIGYYDSDISNYAINEELDKLSPLEKRIIVARYYDNMSQKDIGMELGMYQVEVSRKEKKILQKLRSRFEVKE